MPWELRLMGEKVWGLWLNLWGAFLFVPVCRRGVKLLLLKPPAQNPRSVFPLVSNGWKLPPAHHSPLYRSENPYFLGLPDLSYLRCNCQSRSLKIKLLIGAPAAILLPGHLGSTASKPRRWSFPNLTIFKLQAHIRRLVRKNKLVGDWWRKMISL